MKKPLILLTLFLSVGIYAYAGGCLAPENEAGTIEFPPVCPYNSPELPAFLIIDGLPPGTTMELDGPMIRIGEVTSMPGPGVDELIMFDAEFHLDLTGTGDLSGFQRNLVLPVRIDARLSPRDLGAEIQEFDAIILNMQCEVFGDPDFNFISVTAGDNIGLPSPGHAILQKLPSGDFAVDSFFDITYMIEFQGAPGSVLEGFAGQTTGNTHIQTEPYIPPSPVYFSIHTSTEWMELLNPPVGQSMILPMDPATWEDYIGQQNQFLEEGEPYPPTEFLEPELYVYEDEGDDDDNDMPGLVMTWGDKDMPEGNYASAWIFEYGVDPDLSNATLTIQVEAPCGIQQISVGLQDVNGNRRGWFYNVAPAGSPGGPGLLTCSPGPGINRHTIKINLSMIGVNAAAPVAASYSNNPAFDITKVLNICFDENFNWVPDTAPVPPPGQTDPKPWNYWFNLSISPNGANAYKGYHVKYSQPPVEREEGLIYGWDEKSLYPTPDGVFYGPIMADDWLCEDPRPVTDIHWWGSFLGWKERKLPPVIPSAFHIGIWTDVPAGVDRPYSHPGHMIWENICESWVWNFAGYDIDPRPLPIGMEDEACFQFNQLLSEDEWFFQEPLEGKRIYWLSIAAIYPPGTVPQYPWGWKTRPHHFNDDAVRILDADIWPPNLDPAQPGLLPRWTGGVPVEFPEGVSWDLAFELTTNREIPEEPVFSADINLDGFVDLLDFAIMAQQWLTPGP